MVYNVRINDKLYEVEVEEGKANLLRTETVKAAAPSPASRPAPEVSAASAPPSSPAAPAKSFGAGAIQAAPMPGVVLEIKAVKGQRVKEGELLMILEAMKMENEIFSHTSGVVAEIYAAKGAQVNTGDPLFGIAAEG